MITSSHKINLDWTDNRSLEHKGRQDTVIILFAQSYLQSFALLRYALCTGLCNFLCSDFVIGNKWILNNEENVQWESFFFAVELSLNLSLLFHGIHKIHECERFMQFCHSRKFTLSKLFQIVGMYFTKKVRARLSQEI